MLRVVSLPGDGIGPEVTAVAIDVLRALPIEKNEGIDLWLFAFDPRQHGVQ